MVLARVVPLAVLVAVRVVVCTGVFAARVTVFLFVATRVLNAFTVVFAFVAACDTVFVFAARDVVVRAVFVVAVLAFTFRAEV